jgi:hypothetical protein
MFSTWPRPVSMIDWRWRQTLDSSSTPCGVRTSIQASPVQGSTW